MSGIDRLPDSSSFRYRHVFVYLLCFLISLFFFTYIIGFSTVSGQSMEDTLSSGAVLPVRRINYMTSSFINIERYDIVTVSGLPGGDIVKRVIGLPGETIFICNDTVYVDGVALGGISERCNSHMWFLGDDEYFVLGDNRGGSYDSRDFGAVSGSNITGVVIGSFK